MNRTLKWLRRIAFGVAAAMVLVLAVLYIHEGMKRKTVMERHPAPGRMVDVGTHELHVRMFGVGPVTIVMDAGAGPLGSHGFLPIERQLAEHARVVVYDRAGCNWSERSDAARSPDNIARELHSLVGKLGITGPVVLVGHSQGGLNVMRYASLYRDEVDGLVLLDAAHPQAYARMPADVKRVMLAAQGNPATVDWMARIGVLRLLMPRDAIQLPEPMDGVDNQALALLLTDLFPKNVNDCMDPEYHDGVVNHGLTMDDLSLGALPVTILSASGSMKGPQGPPPGWNDQLEASQVGYWTEMQQGLRQLSSRSRHEVLPGVGHGMHFEQPGPVARHILEMADIAAAAAD